MIKKGKVQNMYTIGLDYGTLSCRGIIADVSNGAIVAEAEFVYPHGVISETLPTGEILPPLYALQDPDDYTKALEYVVPQLMRKSGLSPQLIEAIAIDATSSTVIPVDSQFVPLCKKTQFARNKHAWPKLWKHHAASEQADELNRAAREQDLPVLSDYGGYIGPENLIPKVMQICRESPEVYEAAETFIEYCDYLTSILVGEEIRSGSLLTCKSLWTPENGYPKPAFFESIDPIYKGIPDKLMYHGGRKPLIAWPGESVGKLCPTMASKLGLTTSTVISAPQMDAYSGLIGCGVYDPGHMTMMMGTSTGLMLLGKEKKPVSDICASVKDSILPGFTNYAHGQPCVGDLFGWFVNNCVPEQYSTDAKTQHISVHEYLSRLASEKKPGQNGLIALEWWNGKKLDTGLSGMILGMDLNTKPEDVYRALIEATAFGAKQIIDNYLDHGVAVNRISACGSVATKNEFAMQVYADILGFEIEVVTCCQTAALGAAMYAAKSAEKDSSFEEIIAQMTDRNTIMYKPIAKNTAVYRLLYKDYCEIANFYISGQDRIMERLKKYKSGDKQ